MNASEPLRNDAEPASRFWAPGVLAFQALPFPGKAALISFAFLVPALVLGAVYGPEKVREIRRTSLERSTLSYASDVVVLVQRAQEYRALSMQVATHQREDSLTQAQGALQAQFQRVKDNDARVGAVLGTTPALQVASDKLGAIAPPAEGMLKVYASNAKFIEALYALVAASADGGGLTLDPDLDTAYLMSVGVMKMPSMVDQAARMGGLAAAAAAASSAQGGTIAAAELNRLDTLVEEREEEVGFLMAKVAALDPSLQSALDVAPTAKLINALREEATDDPGQGGADKVAKVQALKDRAVTAAWDLQGRVMQTLDELLARRDQRSWRALEGVALALAASLCVAAYLLYSYFLVTNAGLCEARRQLDRMAEGDLTSTPTLRGRDGSADLMQALLRMQSALREIVTGVRGCAERIAASTGQIAAGVGDISSRTSRAAANLQDSSVSMQEIANSAAQTADFVHQMVDLATQSAGVASEGGAIVEKMVTKMAAIHTSSKRIADIIGVIDSIAFQTNILALNAAVEAARAGEQGRGFAVVAGEVRMLAQRSSAAAREIKGLIGNSVENVEAGAQVARVAGETMSRIVGNADDVCAMLTKVADGAQHQRQRAKEVSGSVQEVDDSTQQNAVLSEQAVAATHDLNQQASELVARVSRFHLPGIVRSAPS